MQVTLWTVGHLDILIKMVKWQCVLGLTAMVARVCEGNRSSGLHLVRRVQYGRLGWAFAATCGRFELILGDLKPGAPGLGEV